LRTPTRQASSATGDRLQRPEVAVDEREGLQRAERRDGEELGCAGPEVQSSDSASQAPSEPSASSAARVTLNQRTAPPRASMTEKTRPADRHRFAAPRHAAELVGDEAADGLEFVGRQGDVERLVDRGERRVAGDALAAAGERVDARLGVVLVELVLDLAHDLLEDVLEREQAGGVAELVDDDGDVVAIGAEVAQQVVEAPSIRERRTPV
jgi:hypothetical protein